jgi:uncharacterized repeat protein (TIGR03803 family)
MTTKGPSSVWLRYTEAILESLASLIVISLIFASIPSASAQTFTVLHTFTGAGDGGNPGSVILDANGNLYGGTWFGGSFNWGAVFKVDTSGKLTVLHNFTGGDGLDGATLLLRDSSGTLYGTTYEGGTPEGGGPGSRYGWGALFKLEKDGKETVLHSWPTGGGVSPGLVRDQNGNLYGTGGLNQWGAVLKWDESGKETVLYRFTGRSDGGNPNGALLRDAAGNLYGTTVAGGNQNFNYGSGVIFMLEPTGKETVLYDFNGGTDGGSPNGNLIRDNEGNFYGTTGLGGDLSCDSGRGCGTVFKLDTSGKETVLYRFTVPPDGQYPDAGLALDAAGNLYGTTVLGGSAGGCSGYGCGIAFKLDRAGKETVLHSFSGGSDGAVPYGVVLDSAGNLYGAASYGGQRVQGYCPYNYGGCGTVFRIVP